MAKIRKNQWFVIVNLSFLLVGSYFSYDLPAALHHVLDKSFHTSGDKVQYEFQIQLLYSVYSVLNIITPLVTGSFINKIGIRAALIGTSTVILAGQTICTLGIYEESFVIVLFGRVIFGLGSESLGVVQSQLAIDWFQGTMLSMVLALNVSISRIGSLLNDIVSPRVESSFGASASFLTGTVLCGVCWISSLYLYKFETGKSRPCNSLEMGVDIENDDTSNSDNYSTKSKTGETAKTNIVSWFSILLQFPTVYWILQAANVLYYSVAVPFNTIEASFVGNKFLDKDYTKAVTLLSYSNGISIILPPFVGFIQDKFGRRLDYLLAASGLYIISHCLLLFSSNVDPALPLILLGFAYVFILTVWPLIAKIVVDPQTSAIAIGLATCIQNAALTFSPLIIAAISKVSDQNYYWEEVFFISCSALSLVLAFLLFTLDRNNNLNGILDNS